MNEKKLMTLILGLLIGINLLLFGYYLYQSRLENMADSEDVQQVQQLYAQAGVDLEAEINRYNPPRPFLRLGEADLDRMAEVVLSSGYDKSYVYGDKVQYSSGDVLIVTDRLNHTITYEDESLGMEKARKTFAENWYNSIWMNEEEDIQQELYMQPVARDFATKWLGDSLYLAESRYEEQGFTFLYYQIQDDTVYYFNQIEVTVLPAGVASASLSYWQVEGKSENVYNLPPIDEILYSQLSLIQTDLPEDDTDAVVRILDGYRLREDDMDNVEAAPTVTLVLRSGRTYVFSP